MINNWVLFYPYEEVSLLRWRGFLTSPLPKAPLAARQQQRGEVRKPRQRQIVEVRKPRQRQIVEVRKPRQRQIVEVRKKSTGPMSFRHSPPRQRQVEEKIMKYRNHNLRKGRASTPGTYYHIIINTHQRLPLLANNKVASIIFETFDWLETKDRIQWICIMIMPDHVHSIIELGIGQTLPKVLHSLKLFTAREINKSLSRRGKFWQAEYRDWAVRDEVALNKMIYYCYANPVRKGLVKAARDYPYWRCKYEMEW